MLEFLFIILIFLEIFLTYFAIGKILKLKEKIEEYNEIVVEKGKIITNTHKKIQEIIKKINFFISIITNKKIWQAKKIITLTIDIIEIIIILKSFKDTKGIKSNLKSLKRLLFTGLGRQFIRTIFNKIILIC